MKQHDYRMVYGAVYETLGIITASFDAIRESLAGAPLDDAEAGLTRLKDRPFFASLMLYLDDYGLIRTGEPRLDVIGAVADGIEAIISRLEEVLAKWGLKPADIVNIVLFGDAPEAMADSIFAHAYHALLSTVERREQLRELANLDTESMPVQ